MCGRYTLHQDSENLATRYKLSSKPDSIRDNFNVAPGHFMPIIVEEDGKPKLEMMKWGLVPVWAKDPNIGYKMINARSESIFEKPAWRSVILKKRCLIPADGFYEWKKFMTDEKERKQPFYIHPKQEEIFSFAGVWEAWKDSENLREVYSKLELIDLTGINVRYQARLKAAGIHTPLQFLDTPAHVLKKEVFRSIVGYYWYVRLRGHEIDNVDTKTRSFGQQYALGQKTYDRQELSRLLMKLCEKTGRRLRKHNYAANGVHLMLGFEDRKYWAKGRKQKSDVYATQDIFYAAQRLLDSATIHCKVTNMSITVFDLHPETHSQQSLFDNTRLDRRSLAVAADEVNDRYGEFTLIPALMTNMQDTILKRVPFGSVRDMDL